MANDSDLDVDLTRINFPSDNVTIRMMRQRHPDHGKELLERKDTDSATDGVSTMFYGEEELAGAAFRRVLGAVAHPERIEHRQAVAEELADIYVEYGLARGKHHAEQLIRDFESQAEAQARQRIGQSL